MLFALSSCARNCDATSRDAEFPAAVTRFARDNARSSPLLSLFLSPLPPSFFLPRFLFLLTAANGKRAPRTDAIAMLRCCKHNRDRNVLGKG